MKYNYNQPLSVVHSGRYIYSKEIHTLTREIELKRIKDYDFKFFIQDKKSTGPFKDVKGNPLKMVKATSIKKFKDQVKAFSDYGHKCYGTNRLGYQYLYEEFDKSKFNNKFARIAYFDIETARDPKTGYSKAWEATNPITTISLVMNGKIYYWARKDLPSDFIENQTDPDLIIPKDHYTGFEFFWFQSEEEMVEHFNRFVGCYGQSSYLFKEFRPYSWWCSLSCFCWPQYAEKSPCGRKYASSWCRNGACSFYMYSLFCGLWRYR